MKHSNTIPRVICAGAIVLMSIAMTGCGGGTSPNGTIKGTAAVGAALANANIQLSCKNGAGSTTFDANGVYSASFKFDGPCAISATSGSIAIHSFASGAGTFNVTPLTQLPLSYVAGDLGTTVDALLVGISSNATFQNALTNSTLIENAQNRVAQLLLSKYGVKLSNNSFLTASFTPGQAGPDADLDALQTAGAISADGQPAASLVSAVYSQGAAAAGGNGSTSGGATGGTGGLAVRRR